MGRRRVPQFAHQTGAQRHRKHALVRAACQPLLQTSWHWRQGLLQQGTVGLQPGLYISDSWCLPVLSQRDPEAATKESSWLKAAYVSLTQASPRIGKPSPPDPQSAFLSSSCLSGKGMWKLQQGLAQFVPSTGKYCFSLEVAMSLGTVLANTQHLSSQSPQWCFLQSKRQGQPLG